MGKIKSALYRFMYGRYGMDTLGTFLLIVYTVMMVLEMILSFFIESPLFYFIWWLIAFGVIIFAIYRMFSRKIEKRRRENTRFCGFFKLRKSKFRDRKTHVYRKCPHCHATLRLPKAKGKHNVVCPRCKNRFSVRG